MDDHRIDARLLQQNHVAGEIARDALVAHGVTAVFHDDDRLVVMQHVRQRLHQILAWSMAEAWSMGGRPESRSMSELFSKGRMPKGIEMPFGIRADGRGGG